MTRKRNGKYLVDDTLQNISPLHLGQLDGEAVAVRREMFEKMNCSLRLSLIVVHLYHSALFDVGLGGTMAHYCITACSEVYSLASNLQAQQQGFAFQQSDSSE